MPQHVAPKKVDKQSILIHIDFFQPEFRSYAFLFSSIVPPTLSLSSGWLHISLGKNNTTTSLECWRKKSFLCSCSSITTLSLSHSLSFLSRNFLFYLPDWKIALSSSILLTLTIRILLHQYVSRPASSLCPQLLQYANQQFVKAAATAISSTQQPASIPASIGDKQPAYSWTCAASKQQFHRCR